MQAPNFWWKRPGFLSTALGPFGTLYGAVAGRRLNQKGTRVDVPVICIGDPTLGGAGKTPTAIAVARILTAQGEKPFFLTRGYGGREKGPVLVDLTQQSAADVGDEPLLLAAAAATVVSIDRVAGAARAAISGASVIVMDDGFQNPALVKDVSLLVVDGTNGVGNGLTFPAGPLRAPLATQLRRAEAVVLVGKGDAGDLIARRANNVLRARIEPEQNSARALADKKLLAYAGIGRPQKFFSTLESIGAQVSEQRIFSDHHAFSMREANELLEIARERNLTLVTTEKDFTRLRKNPALKTLAEASRVLPITLVFEDENALREILRKALARR